MDIQALHPEIRKVFRLIPSLPFHSKLFVRLNNLLLRTLPEAKSIAGLTIQQQSLSHGALRIYRPTGQQSGAGLLWIHGGGMITGRAAQDDRLCGRFARQLGLVVYSVDYRLAPRHPFPAALDDCLDAWRCAQDLARDHGVDVTRFAIAGQSAGAGLAASLAHKLSDLGGPQPAAVALFSPMLDDRTAARRELDTLNHRIWNNRSNRAGWSAYLGQTSDTQEPPAYAVAARREQLGGSPPTWIGIGDIDLFAEESQAYAERLRSAGVHCDLHLAPMAPHAFETIAPESSIARELFADNQRFLRNALQISED